MLVRAIKNLWHRDLVADPETHAWVLSLYRAGELHPQTVDDYFPLAAAEDETLRASMARHSADEARHVKIYDGAIAKLGQPRTEFDGMDVFNVVIRSETPATFRTDVASHQELRDIYGREVVTLKLIDPSFYHLDTAFAVLDSAGGPGSVAFLPKAFDAASLDILDERFPDAIHVTDEDAAVLGLNSFSDGKNVVIASRAKDFEHQLIERGFVPHGLDLSELLLGGGGVKCCTLELRG